MELKIFSSPFSVAAFCAVIGLYLLTAVIRIIFGDEKEGRIIITVLSVLNMIAHVALFALCVYLKCTPQEMLFTLVISTALALTVSKLGNGKEV